MKKLNTPLIIASAIVISVILLTSCKKDEANLNLNGIWVEQPYDFNQSVPNDYDTSNHTKKRIQFDCSGKFHLILTTYHKVYEGDVALGEESFQEYVSGDYTANDKNLSLKGAYYTDSTFTVLSKEDNTPYSYGNYLWDADYKIDSKRLTLGLDASSRNDINTFTQQQAFECL